MVSKLFPPMIALFIIMSVPAVASAAVCGDGVCESGENCLDCPRDCGTCNGLPCAYDDDCASRICCEYVCESSCVIYPASDDSLSGFFILNPTSIFIVEAIAMTIGFAVIVFLLFKKYYLKRDNYGYQNNYRQD